MLEFCGVTAGYGRYGVLHDITLTAKRGKITTLVGVNGCGKSTLLKTAVGLLPLTAGEIRVDGVPLSAFSAAARARRLAYLPQEKKTPDMTAGRLVLHGRFPYLGYPRKYRREDMQIAAATMEQMQLSALADMPVAALSGGMRQKVYIAAALAQQTPVILMDEPTAYLDIGERLRLAQTVRALSAEGKAVLLVLHDILLALKTSDVIAVMDAGRIAACGAPQEILSSGILDAVYGVHIRTVHTAAGMQYYYEMP